MQYVLDLGLEKYQEKGYLIGGTKNAVVFVKKTPSEVLKELKRIDAEVFRDFGTHPITFLNF